MVVVVIERGEGESHVEERDLGGKQNEMAVEKKLWVDEKRSLETSCLIRGNFVIERVMCSM